VCIVQSAAGRHTSAGTQRQPGPTPLNQSLPESDLQGQGSPRCGANLSKQVDDLPMVAAQPALAQPKTQDLTQTRLRQGTKRSQSKAFGTLTQSQILLRQIFNSR
jgi:hypothetical protein